MILVWALIVSIGVALLRGGKFSQLAGVSFRYGWVALIALALQIVVIYYPLRRTEGFWGTHTLLVSSSYALLLTVAALNYRLPGMPVVAVGLLLNLTVMLANGGFMPVTFEALERARLTHLALGSEPGARLMATKDIILPREQTHLWLLSDIFAVPWPSPIRTIFSLGDLLLGGGAFVLFQRTMLPKRARSQAD